MGVRHGSHTGVHSAAHSALHSDGKPSHPPPGQHVGLICSHRRRSVGRMQAHEQVKTERCRDTWSMMLLMLSWHVCVST